MSDSLPKRKIWHYQPADLVPYNPLFNWPPKIGQSFNWMVRRWVSVSRFVLFIALGFIIHHYLTPSYEVMKGFSLDWILSVFLRSNKQ